jgi:hypothetical protein
MEAWRDAAKALELTEVVSGEYEGSSQDGGTSVMARGRPNGKVRWRDTAGLR